MYCSLSLIRRVEVHKNVKIELQADFQPSRVLYVKPLNERLIILLQKKIVILASFLDSQSIFYSQN